MSGVIKYTKFTDVIFDDPVFIDAELFQMLSFLVHKANFKDNTFPFNGELIDVKRGSILTGRNVIAENLKIAPSTAYNRLQRLKKLKRISIIPGRNYSIITILKYNDYTVEPMASEFKPAAIRHLSDNNLTVNQQSLNTKNNVYNDNNVNNVNKENNNLFVQSVIDNINMEDCKYLSNQAVKDKWIDFLDSRNALNKPITPQAQALLLQQLEKDASNETEAIAVIDYSIIRGYSKLYPYQSENKSSVSDDNIKYGTTDRKCMICNYNLINGVCYTSGCKNENIKYNEVGFIAEDLIAQFKRKGK